MCFLAQVLCFAGPGWAQEKPQGSGKLTAIKVTGSKRFPEATIAAASGLRAGQEVHKEDLQAAADRLGALGPFVDVHYKFTSLGDRVTVEFQLNDATMVPVSFDNFPWFTDEEIVQALKDAVPFFDGAAPEQGAVLDAMNEALQRLIGTRAVSGLVEHHLVGLVGSEGNMMQFALTGANLKMNGLRFQDALLAKDPRMEVLSRQLVGKPFSRFAVELFCQEQVRPIYLERGNLRVKFGTPQARFTGDPTKPLADNVLVLVAVEPGPVYRWGGVTWSGNAAVSTPVLDSMVTLPVGEPANGMTVSALWERVNREYGKRGYLDAKIEPVVAYDDAKQRVAYKVEFAEGPLYRMGDLVITGLSVRAERIIREAWGVAQGASFDRVYLDEFLATGIKNAFGDYVVHYDEVGHLLRTNPGTRTVDVLIDFK